MDRRYPTRKPDEWERVGRGSNIEFYATDDDLLEMFAAVSRATSTTIGFLAIEADGEGRHLVECQRQDMRICLTRGEHQVIVTSGTNLAAAVPEPALLDEEAWVLSGFVILDHGFLWHGRHSASRFARINQVRHLVAGKVGINQAGKALFDAVRRDMRKRVIWSSVRLLADGTPDEDDRVSLMTDRAAFEARQNPDKWEVTPGRRIR